MKQPGYTVVTFMLIRRTVVTAARVATIGSDGIVLIAILSRTFNSDWKVQGVPDVRAAMPITDLLIRDGTW